MGHALESRALRGALAGTGAVAVVAVLGSAVRLLPWLLDPAVTFRLASPFVRGLLALAFEAALVVGWPVGWALSAVQLVERGEARALETLGQSPMQTVLRLGWQATLFACALGTVSFIGGREASEPGRVITDLVARGRESCETIESPGTYAVPFAGVTWLCAPGQQPHLVGHGPGALASTLFTANGARAAGDLREIDLEGAHVLLGMLDVHVGLLRLRGLSPFTHASGVEPVARALALALAGAIAALGGALGVLRGALRGRLAAILSSAGGALAALGVMRWIERSDGPGVLTLLIPLATLGVTALAWVATSLPRRRWTASK